MALKDLDLARRAGSLPGVLVAVAVMTLFWDTWLLWPLKLMTVFFHEISHNIAAFLTGGSFGRIVLESNEGGKAWPVGGSRFLVLNAGYVGSLLWGSGLVLAAASMKRDRLLTGLLGAFLGTVTVVYVRSPFGFLFGLASAAGLVWSSYRLSDAVNDALLKVIGATSCLYVIPDIWSDVFTSSCNSDAKMLAREYFGPRLMWGGLWIGASVAVLLATLRTAAKISPRD
ncbi:MAG: M50 family metallopeptidase [Elusimicrobia bacterium]|nr:M50 family metallopeptidase [Elusimicrobiota bacterium]